MDLQPRAPTTGTDSGNPTVVRASPAPSTVKLMTNTNPVTVHGTTPSPNVPVVHAPPPLVSHAQVTQHPPHHHHHAPLHQTHPMNMSHPLSMGHQMSIDLNHPQWKIAIDRLDRSMATSDLMTSLSGLYGLVMRSNPASIKASHLDLLRQRIMKSVIIKQSSKECQWTLQCTERYSVLMHKMTEIVSGTKNPPMYGSPQMQMMPMQCLVPGMYSSHPSQYVNQHPTVVNPHPSALKTTTMPTTTTEAKPQTQQPAQQPAQKKIKTETPAAYVPEPFKRRKSNANLVKEELLYNSYRDLMKVMSKVLPKHTEVSEDAKDLMQDCATEFVLFLLSEARDCAKFSRVAQIDGPSIVAATYNLGYVLMCHCHPFSKQQRFHRYKHHADVLSKYQEKIQKVIVTKPAKSRAPRPTSRSSEGDTSVPSPASTVPLSTSACSSSTDTGTEEPPKHQVVVESTVESSSPASGVVGPAILPTGP